MALNLTYAENADAVRRHRKRPTRGQIIAAVVFLLVFAASFGLLIYPDPIRGY